MLQRIKTLFSSQKAITDEEILAELGDLPSAKSITVSAANASNFAPFGCARRTIAEATGRIPVHLYRRDAGGNRDRDTAHPAHKLLRRDANPWTSASDLRVLVTGDAIDHGNGFAFVNRVQGRPVEILRLRPRSVTCTPDEMTGEPVYVLNSKTGRRVLDRRDVIHIRTSVVKDDGLNGVSYVSLARKSIALGLAMEAHADRLMRAGARPSGTLETEKRVTPQLLAQLRQLVESQASGENSGNALILGDGIKFNPLTFNSVDLQFLELRKYAVEEISRHTSVPPHRLYELGRATWGNQAEQEKVFVNYCLMHWIKQWEGALTRTLLSDQERNEYFVEFLLDDLLSATPMEKANALSKLVSSCILNPNEARAIGYNKGPYPKGDSFLNPNVISQTPDKSEDDENRQG